MSNLAALPMGKRHSGPLYSLLAIVWLAVCSAGLWALWGYQYTPGQPALRFPRRLFGNVIKPSAGAGTLLLFVHPRCPCTRASIDSLALIMTQSRGKIAAYALFFKPVSFAEKWERSDLWEEAAAIPGVTVLKDEGGAQAGYF